jgi:hypothetical protein
VAQQKVKHQDASGNSEGWKFLDVGVEAVVHLVVILKRQTGPCTSRTPVLIKSDMA